MQCRRGTSSESSKAHFVFKTTCLSVTRNSQCFPFLLRLIAINCFQTYVVHFLSCHPSVRPFVVSHFLYFSPPLVLLKLLLRLQHCEVRESEISVQIRSGENQQQLSC
jgi:hypothetical protein